MFMIMHAHCEGLIPRRGDCRPRPMIPTEPKDINGRPNFVDRKGQTDRPSVPVRQQASVPSPFPSAFPGGGESE